MGAPFAIVKFAKVAHFPVPQVHVLVPAQRQNLPARVRLFMMFSSREANRAEAYNDCPPHQRGARSKHLAVFFLWSRQGHRYGDNVCGQHSKISRKRLLQSMLCRSWLFEWFRFDPAAVEGQKYLENIYCLCPAMFFFFQKQFPLYLWKVSHTRVRAPFKFAHPYPVLVILVKVWPINLCVLNGYIVRWFCLHC